MSQTCTECGFPMDTPERAHAFIHHQFEALIEHRKALRESTDYAVALQSAAAYARTVLGDWVQGVEPASPQVSKAWHLLDQALTKSSHEIGQRNCPACHGSGEMPATVIVPGTADLSEDVIVDCARCQGTGKWRCCGAADPGCTTWESSCQNPANYPPPNPVQARCDNCGCRDDARKAGYLCCYDAGYMQRKMGHAVVHPQPLKPNDIDGPLYRVIRAVAASRVMFPQRDSFAAPAPFDLKVADLEAVIDRMVSWWDAQEGHSQVPKQEPPKVEPIFKLPQPKRSFKVGDQAGCYVGNHHGELTAGLVVAILDLPGWQWPHYVIEIETGIDPIYEVRDGFTAHPCPAQVTGNEVKP